MAVYEYSWQKNELGQYCYKQTKKKRKLPSWLTALLVSVLVSAVLVAVFAFLILPNMRTPAVISQTSDGPVIVQDAEGVSFVGLGEKLTDSVVEIVAESGGMDSFFDFMPFYSSNKSGGSGLVVTADGYILTGLAAVESANATVRLADGTEYQAAVVGTDARTGIAVLKIEKNGLTPVEFADSSALSSGMSVAAIGRFFGEQMGPTLTLGTINSVKKGVTLQNGQSLNLFQTDAALSGSGSAIVDAEGKVVGIVTGMISSGVDGIELAVPSNDIVNALQSLISFGTAPEGLVIGIRGIDTDHGVMIDSVGKDTPAEKAGLKKDDLILKADSKTVKSVDEINALKNEHQKGDVMTFTIYRDGEMLDVEVTL